MASVQWDKTGPLVVFTGPDGRRRKMRLTELAKNKSGNVVRDEAGQERITLFVAKLKRLIAAAKHGHALDDDLLAWTSSDPKKRGRIGDAIREKFVEYGLLQDAAEVKKIPTLGEHIEQYIAERRDVKPGTEIFYRQTQTNLLQYFGADKPLAEITKGAAKAFRAWLLTKKEAKGAGLAEMTARRRCTMSSQFFNAAVEHRYIDTNPFRGVGGSVRSNRARVRFISLADSLKVMESCPDNETRLVFALARFGALRTPSETFRLKWEDVNWAENKFLVHSPKTERHADGGQRWVPIFPELRPLFDQAWAEAPTPPPMPDKSASEAERSRIMAEREEATYVIQKLRHHANLGVLFARITKRAGLFVWPKYFQNMRSTRQTELVTITGSLADACTIVGNKTATAMEHYHQMTDGTMNKAGSTTTPDLSGGAFLGHPMRASGALRCSSTPGESANEQRRTLVNTAGDEITTVSDRPGGIRTYCN